MEATAEAATNDAHHEPVTIIVNGQPKSWDHERINFEQLVQLAYPTPPPGQIEYKITYSRGPPHNPLGNLLPGESVQVKQGMVFDVVPTVKS